MWDGVRWETSERAARKDVGWGFWLQATHQCAVCGGEDHEFIAPPPADSHSTFNSSTNIWQGIHPDAGESCTSTAAGAWWVALTKMGKAVALLFVLRTISLFGIPNWIERKRWKIWYQTWLRHFKVALALDTTFTQGNILLTWRHLGDLEVVFISNWSLRYPCMLHSLFDSKFKEKKNCLSMPVMPFPLRYKSFN